MNSAANSKPGYKTMAAALNRDLIELEEVAYRAPSKANLARVVAVREELGRVERGEL